MLKNLFKRKDRLHILTYSFIAILGFTTLAWAAYTSFSSIQLNPSVDETYTIRSNTTSGTRTFSVTPAGDVYALTNTFGTGTVSSSEIADVTRSFALQLGAGGVDGGNDVDDASTPDMTTCDDIPCLVWDASAETTAVAWTFRLPSDFVSGLVVYALVSSDAASGAGMLLDWAVWQNKTNTTFDAAAIPQTAVECTNATLNVSNEVLTLTSNASAEAAYTAGDWITLEFFNASTDDDDLELKGLEVTYTATQ